MSAITSHDLPKRGYRAWSLDDLVVLDANHRRGNSARTSARILTRSLAQIQSKEIKRGLRRGAQVHPRSAWVGLAGISPPSAGYWPAERPERDEIS
jgi:hypothetical protein